MGTAADASWQQHTLPPPTQQQKRHVAHKLLTRLLSVLVLVGAGVCFAYSLRYSFRTFELLSGPVWSPASLRFFRNAVIGESKGYALCSPEGQRRIYTVDASNTVVECIAVVNERVAYAGSRESLDVKVKRVQVLPEGATVLPGFSDSHTHLLHYGSSRLIPLEAGKTVQEVVTSVREYILANPEFANNKSKTVEGWGWNHMGWDEQRLPTAADLDADPIIRGRHVILESKDGHAFWVSGTTLKTYAPYPDAYPGGSIIRDENGEPTGVFLDNAQALIHRPVWSHEDMAKRLDLTVEDLLKNGLTSAHDAMLFPYMADFFQEMAFSGKLPIRVRAARYFDPDNGTYWGDKIKPLHNTANDRLSIRSVKFVGDGAMRSGGCAMKEPYTDNPYDKGFMRVDAETMYMMTQLYLLDGWQLVMHAIGDLANEIVIDAIRHALEVGHYNVSEVRPRMEHLQILSPEDIPKVGKIGIIASVQPSHIISDMWFAEQRIGYERSKGLYAFRGLADGGARITLGTDLPVDSPSPFKTFYAAITRIGLDGTSPHGPGGFFPKERLTRLEVLRGMTIEPAYASFTEDILGSLEVGKRADFVVVDRDLMEVDAVKIPDTQVLATAIDGEVVYGKLFD